VRTATKKRNDNKKVVKENNVKKQREGTLECQLSTKLYYIHPTAKGVWHIYGEV